MGLESILGCGHQGPYIVGDLWFPKEGPLDIHSGGPILAWIDDHRRVHRGAGTYNIHLWVHVGSQWSRSISGTDTSEVDVEESELTEDERVELNHKCYGSCTVPPGRRWWGGQSTVIVGAVTNQQEYDHDVHILVEITTKWIGTVGIQSWQGCIYISLIDPWRIAIKEIIRTRYSIISYKIRFRRV